MSMLKSLSSVALLIALGAALVGCDNSESTATGTGAGTTGASQQTTAATKPATKPIIPVAQMEDWCREHGMPESICVQCNASLAAAFKEKGDWDDQHNLPKSQCVQCDPSLKEKFAAAYKAKYGKDAPTGGEDAH